MIERELGGVALVQRSFTEDYYYDQILRPAHGNPKIILRRSPVVSVASIQDQDSPVNSIASTDYWINKRFGWLVSTGAWQIPQNTNGFQTYWTIVYTAGHFAATANVDANLKLACKMLVAGLYDRPDEDVTTKSVGDLSLSYADRGGQGDTISIPPKVAMLIAAYKRRDV